MVQADVVINVRGNLVESFNLAAQGIQKLTQNANAAMPQITQLTNALQQAGFTVVPKLSANLNDAALQSRSLAQDFQKLGSSMGKTFSWISKIAMGVMIANFAYRFKDAITGAIASAKDMYDTIRRIQWLTQDFTTTQVEYFQIFQRAAEDTFYSLKETSEAARVLAQSGVNVKDNIEILTAVLNMGTISMMDLGDASRVMVQILKAFSMNASEAGHVADVMAKVADLTTAEVGDLAHGMTYLAAVAAMSGISFEEAAAALGMLTTSMGDSGIASRGLRSALTSLASPSREARQEMAKYGILQRIQAEDAHSLADLTRIFNEQLAGTADKYSILSRIFETQGATAFMQLMLLEDSAATGMANLGDQVLSLGGILGALGDSTGYAQDAVDYMMDSLTGDIAKFKRELESLGQLLLETITPAARDLVQTFTELLADPSFRDTLKVLAQSLVDVVVPIAKGAAELIKLLGAVKGVIPWIVKLVAAYYLLKTGIFVVNTIMSLGRWITEQKTLAVTRLNAAYAWLRGGATEAATGQWAYQGATVAATGTTYSFTAALYDETAAIRTNTAETERNKTAKRGMGGAALTGVATLGAGIGGMFLGGALGQAAGTAIGGEAGGAAGGMVGSMVGMIGLPAGLAAVGGALGFGGAAAIGVGGGVVTGIVAAAMAMIGGMMNAEAESLHTGYMQLLATDADAAEQYRLTMLASGKDVTMGWREVNKAGFDYAQALVDQGQAIGYLIGAFRILQAWIGQIQESFAVFFAGMQQNIANWWFNAAVPWIQGIQQGIANWWTAVVEWWTQAPPAGATPPQPLQTGGFVSRAGVFSLHTGEAVVPASRVQEALTGPRELNVTIRVEGAGAVTGIDADRLGDILLANVSRAIYLGKDYG